MRIMISLATPNMDKFKQSLVKLCKEYHKFIPLSTINDYANANGYRLIDEDGSDWEGMLTGREGRASIDIEDADGKKLKTALHLQWHKLTTGKYELNAYVS